MVAKKARKPGALREGDRFNFSTLTRAAENGDLALMSAIRKSDGKQVALVCAMDRQEESGRGVWYRAVPLAVMIESNPYKLFHDPTK